MRARSGKLRRSATWSETSAYGSACSYWARAMRNSGVSHSRTGSAGDASSSDTRRSLRAQAGESSARGHARPARRRAGQLPRGHADSAPLADGVDHLEVQAVPAAGARGVEALGMPEDREPAAVLRGPVEQREDPRLRSRGRQAPVTLLGEGRVHHRERHLDEIRRPVALEIPDLEGMCDPGAETEGVA